MHVSTLPSYKSKRIKNALKSFEWHVTYTDSDGLSLCGKCLHRSIKELNNLTGRRLTEQAVYAVGVHACEQLITGALLRSLLNWAIGQYSEALICRG